jgi:RNA polymerase sigma factor (sigma-70 family)
MSDNTEDIELKFWEGLRKGDGASLAWIYNRYFRLLYNYGKKLSVDERSLEDGIHDLFVDLWRFRENLSATSSVRFYLYRALRRRLVRNENHVKRALSHSDTLPEYLKPYAACEEESIIEKEVQSGRVSQLKKLLGDLSPRQYEAMVLRFYDELSFEEIGAILNVNEQSARNLVQRGLSQLKNFSKFLLACWVLVN